MVPDGEAHGADEEDESEDQGEAGPRRADAERRVDDQLGHAFGFIGKDSLDGSDEDIGSVLEQVHRRLGREGRKEVLRRAAGIDEGNDGLRAARRLKSLLDVSLGCRRALDDGEVGVGRDGRRVAGEDGDGVVAGEGILRGDGAVAPSGSGDEEVHFASGGGVGVVSSVGSK